MRKRNNRLSLLYPDLSEVALGALGRILRSTAVDARHIGQASDVKKRIIGPTLPRRVTETK